MLLERCLPGGLGQARAGCCFRAVPVHQGRQVHIQLPGSGNVQGRAGDGHSDLAARESVAVAESVGSGSAAAGQQGMRHVFQGDVAHILRGGDRYGYAIAFLVHPHALDGDHPAANA